MHAIKTKDIYSGPCWKLTDDAGEVAEALPEDIIYDVNTVEDLLMELTIKQPAPEGFTFFTACSHRSTVQEHDARATEDVSDEALFAAAREFGSVTVSGRFAKIYGHHLGYNHKLVVIGDFILSSTTLIHDPKKARTTAKKAVTSVSKDVTNGDPKIDLIRAVVSGMRKLAFGHHVFKGFEMYRAVHTFGQNKASMCRELLSYVRIIHSFHQSRDEWRKDKDLIEAIKVLIPYAPGMRKRALFKDEKDLNVWWKRMAVFLEHEQDANAASFLEGNRVCEAVGA